MCLLINVTLYLRRDRYTLAELLIRPLPEGVDPSKMEIYLAAEEFKVCLKEFVWF